MIKHAPLLFIVTCGFILFGINIWGYNLWSPDEPRFAEVAREILQTHNWILMHVNGEPYYEKPPLLFWAIATFSIPLGGVSELTARMPSVLSAVFTLLLTFLLAERLYGKRVALASGVILMTLTLFWWEARTAQTDMLLTVWTTLSLYAFWRHYESRETKWVLVFYGAMVAAVFTKGPPGAVFPVLLAVFFYWGKRQERRSLHLFWGIAVVALLIACWLVPAYIMADRQEVRPEIASNNSVGLILANLYRQTVGRFLLGVSKKQPPWYFFQNFPADFFPGTLFLPWTLWAVWKRRREGPSMRLLLSWTLPAVIFFSISSGKRTIYLLPLYPAVAILFGTTIQDLMDGPRATWRRVTGYVWAVILLALGLPALPLAYYAMVGHAGRLETFLVGHGWAADLPNGVMGAVSALLPFSVCALIFAVHAMVRASRAEARTVHYAMAGHFAGLAVLAVLTIFPYINLVKGASDFCAPIRKLADAGDKFRLYSVAFSREEYIFYSRHYHTPFLVDDWPLPKAAGSDPAQFVRKQQALGSVLRGATRDVAIADWAAVTPEEMAKLESASDAAFAFAASKTKVAEPFRQALTEAVRKFAQDFNGAEPSFLFVQTDDWRWLLPLAPAMRTFQVITSGAVGSRDVLLIANQAGVALLRQDGRVARAVVGAPDPAVVQINS